jgi:hypothetical protein
MILPTVPCIDVAPNFKAMLVINVVEVIVIVMVTQMEITVSLILVSNVSVVANVEN